MTNSQPKQSGDMRVRDDRHAGETDLLWHGTSWGVLAGLLSVPCIMADIGPVPVWLSPWSREGFALYMLAGLAAVAIPIGAAIALTGVIKLFCHTFLRNYYRSSDINLIVFLVFMLYVVIILFAPLFIYYSGLKDEDLVKTIHIALYSFFTLLTLFHCVFFPLGACLPKSYVKWMDFVYYACAVIGLIIGLTALSTEKERFDAKTYILDNPASKEEALSIIPGLRNFVETLDCEASDKFDCFELKIILERLKENELTRYESWDNPKSINVDKWYELRGELRRYETARYHEKLLIEPIDPLDPTLEFSIVLLLGALAFRISKVTIEIRSWHKGRLLADSS